MSTCLSAQNIRDDEEMSIVEPVREEIIPFCLASVYYVPDRRKGGSKRCFCPFVRPSVCPPVRLSVAYIANTSRTRRPSVPKFGLNLPHH